jgi:hypothetical protein
MQETPQTRQTMPCTAPPDADAMALLDNICSYTDNPNPFGGGFCNGGFNWGPGGDVERIVSQYDLTNHGVAVPGLNCAVDIESRSCKYSRVANANLKGDVLYKNLGYGRDDACNSLPKGVCDNVRTKFGICAWSDGDGKCVGNSAYAGGFLPLCVSSPITRDCAEAADDALCQMREGPDVPTHMVGLCKNGQCILQSDT